MAEAGLERKKRRHLWWQKQKNRSKKDTKGKFKVGVDQDTSKTTKPKKSVGKLYSKGKHLVPVSSRGFRRSTAEVSARETLTESDADRDIQSPSDRDLASSEESTSESECEMDSIPSIRESPVELRLEPTPLETKSSKKRYILFFGNLPYNATTEEITTHFERRGVPIKELRLLTHKETGKSRGCAFADFESNKAMQNALKFHRSRFKGKRVNIEVTCGGGGSKESRKEKIREKNRTHRKKVAIKQGKHFKKKR